MFTPNVQKEIIDLYNEGTSTRRIARIYHVGEPKIVQLLAENNIFLRESSYARPYNKVSKDKVIECYKDGMSKNRLMKMFGISEATITKIICESGLSIRKKTEKTEDEIKAMIDFYLRSGNIAKTAKNYGVSANYVRKRLVEKKLHKPTKQKSHIDDKTISEIIGQYKNDYKVKDIAVNFCISPTTVRRILHKSNVKTSIPYRRITMSDYNEIISKRENGDSFSAIAEFFNISERTVKRIVSGEKCAIKTVIDDKTENAIIKRCKLGIPLAKIARDLNIPVSQVTRISQENLCVS